MKVNINSGKLEKWGELYQKEKRINKLKIMIHIIGWWESETITLK